MVFGSCCPHIFQVPNFSIFFEVAINGLSNTYWDIIGM
jgi:hypothetical protein